MGWQASIERPSRRTRLLLYGAAPLILVGSMAVFYYADSPFLRRLVSPELEGVPGHVSREFGLLESMQNLLLLAIGAVALAGFRRKQLRAERLALGVLLAGAAWMLLEETDYLTQYALLFGTEEAGASPLNLHHLGYLRTLLESLAYFGMLTFFGGFAILFAESPKPVLRYLAPDRFAVLTVLLITALQELVWWHSASVPRDHGTLFRGEIEFLELGMYALALLWTVDLVFWRRCERID